MKNVTLIPFIFLIKVVRSSVEYKGDEGKSDTAEYEKGMVCKYEEKKSNVVRLLSSMYYWFECSGHKLIVKRNCPAEYHNLTSEEVLRVMCAMYMCIYKDVCFPSLSWWLSRSILVLQSNTKERVRSYQGKKEEEESVFCSSPLLPSLSSQWPSLYLLR